MEVLYPSTAWGMKEISVCLRGLMMDCMLCAMCLGGGFLGPISAKYWRVVKTLKTCLSPRVMSICEMTDITLISMLTVARTPTWKLHAGSNGHQILPPALKPHNHHYDVSKMFVFLDALELLPDAWL